MAGNIVVLLNGPAGSGKTTVARALFERLGSCALLDVDALTTVEPFEWGKDLSLLGLRNAAAVIHNFHAAGFSQVILAGGAFRQDLVDALADLLPPGTRLCYFWLGAERSVRHGRCLARARDGADAAEFLDWRDRLMPYPGPLHVPGGRYYEVDTTALSPEQAAEAMLVLLQGEGLVLRDP